MSPEIRNYKIEGVCCCLLIPSAPAAILPAVSHNKRISALCCCFRVLCVTNTSSANIHVKRENCPLTGRGGPLGYETSRVPQFTDLDDRLIDGGEVSSLTCRPPLNHRKISGTHFCQRSRPRAVLLPVVLG
jgi:hypothetical protein